MSINNFVCTGNVTNKHPLKTVGEKQTSIVEFGLAWNNPKRKGEKDETSFYNLVAFGGMADTIDKYVSVGDQLTIQGELVQERWEKDGQKRSDYKVRLNAFSFGKRKSDSPKNEKSTKSQAEEPPIPPKEEIPF